MEDIQSEFDKNDKEFWECASVQEQIVDEFDTRFAVEKRIMCKALACAIFSLLAMFYSKYICGGPKSYFPDNFWYEYQSCFILFLFSVSASWILIEMRQSFFILQKMKRNLSKLDLLCEKSSKLSQKIFSAKE